MSALFVARTMQELELEVVWDMLSDRCVRVSFVTLLSGYSLCFSSFILANRHQSALQNMGAILLKWNTVMGILSRADHWSWSNLSSKQIWLFNPYALDPYRERKFTLEGGRSVENGAKHRKSKFAPRREQLLEANSILPVYVCMC